MGSHSASGDTGERRWRPARWALIVSAVGVLVGGCGVAPEDAVEGLMRAVARGDVRRAGQYLTPALRVTLTNFPGCVQLLRYSVRSLRWEVRDLYATTNGMWALVPFVSVRETPPPSVMQGTLLMRLVPDGAVWRVAAVEVSIPEYVEFVTTPQGGQPYSMWSLTKPRWEKKQALRESLLAFAQRMEAYWWSFRQ